MNGTSSLKFVAMWKKQPENSTDERTNPLLSPLACHECDLEGIVGLVLVGCAESFMWPPAYNSTLWPYVNGTDLYSPVLKGFGQNKFAPFETTVVPWYQNWGGNALLVDFQIYGISPEQTVRNLLKIGLEKGYAPPTAVLVPGLMEFSGFVAFARDYSDGSDIKIPVVEVGAVAAITIQVLANLSTPINVPIILVDDDPIAMFFYWTFYDIAIVGITCGCIGLVCVIVNVYKFQLHLRWTSGITTPKIFFMVDLLANFMRIWYLVIDPFYIAHISYLWTTVCTSTHLALTIVCTLLIATKWRELLEKTKLHATMFLSKYRYPFIVAGTLIFMVEFISSCLRGHWFNVTKLSLASWSFLLIMGTVVSLLLLFSGFQILLQISKAVGGKRVILLNRTTLLLMASGVTLFGWSMTELAFILWAYRFNHTNIYVFNILVTLLMLWLFATSFLQNWAMPLPDNPRRTTSTEAMSRSRSSKTGSKGQITQTGKESAIEDVGVTTVATGIMHISSSTTSSEDEEEEAKQLTKQRKKESAEESEEAEDSESEEESEEEEP